MYATREDVECICEGSKLLSLYKLRRDDSLLLYRLAEGQTLADVAVELDRQESSLYHRCRIIQKKFGARTFKQVMFLFGKCISD